MAGKRLSIPINLRWGDLDAYNHVNNTSMLKLLEEARVRAFWSSEIGERDYPTAVLTSGLEDGLVSLIARQEIEYLAQVPYQREPLEVELWFGRLGGSSIEVCYEVYSPKGSDPRVLYARSSATLVVVNGTTGRPSRLTSEMREAWAPYLGDPVEYSRR